MRTLKIILFTGLAALSLYAGDVKIIANSGVDGQLVAASAR